MNAVGYRQVDELRNEHAGHTLGDVIMDIYGFLAQHGIPYDRVDHPPVFTCDEAAVQMLVSILTYGGFGTSAESS